MRTATLPLTFTLTLAVWFFQVGARADEHAHGHDDHYPEKAVLHESESDADAWKVILASLKLGKADRALLEEIRPFLDPADFRALEPNQRKNFFRYAENRLHSERPLARCWSPSTPIHLLSAFHAIEEAALASEPAGAPRKANQFFQRWSRTATNGPGQNVQGRPITLTWSIVPDGTPIPSDPAIGDSADASDLRARLAEIYGGDTGTPENQPWFRIFENVFAQITEQTGINYVYEPNDDGQQLSSIFRGRLGMRGDLRLGGHDIDGNSSTLAYNYFPDNGDMIIDTNDNWFENIANDSVRLANTLAHEHGHGVGLQHVCPIDQTKLLEPFINTSFRGMQFDDIYTLQRWYGDAFEHHGNARDNDSIPRARALPVWAGTPFGFEWLSIDDNSDVDYYSVNLPPGSQVTARVIPSAAIYLEGEQSPNGTCASGTPFDSNAIHDLTLELLSGDSTVLASSTANPAGDPEEILSFPVPSGGSYFLRVNGDSANSAQLYRLEVEITSPSVIIGLQDHTIVAESHAPANGRVEPGETIKLQLELLNNGALDGANVQATLSGPPNFTGFTTTQSYGTLSPGIPKSSDYVFALEGDCGQSIPLQLSITADEGFARTVPVRLVLGTVTSVFKERFDLTGGMSLPSGWTSSNTGLGSGWDLDTDHDTPAYSVFAENQPSLGTSILTTPSMTLGPEGGTLRFRHNFDTEASNFNPQVGFDGGVLEIKVGNDDWEDILEAGGTFGTGAYTRTLASGFQNPLPNRQAWSGTSDGWITTVVNVPDTLGDESVQFRWRLGHDTSSAEVGWFIDTIELTSATCDDTLPAVQLVVDDDSASEWAPLDRAQLTVTSELPPLSDLEIHFLNTGTATLGLDALGLENIILPSGDTSVQITVQAVNDSASEGEETLVLSLDPAAEVVLEGPAATLIITDTPFGTWAAATIGLDPANGPLDDFDLDGALNLAEYAWHTDATSSSSRPSPRYYEDNGFLRAEVPLGTLPGDVLLQAETSTDLMNWSPVGVETLPDGFRVPLNGAPQRYLRVVSDLISPP